MDINEQYITEVDDNKEFNSAKDGDYNERAIDESFKEGGDDYDENGDLETGKHCKTYGMGMMWNTNVNLGDPVLRDKECRKEVLHFYNTLQYILHETGFPETEDRTAIPRRDNNKEIVWLECFLHLTIALRRYLNTWVSKQPHKKKAGLYELFIFKAITFHKGGLTYIDEFNPPRKCTCLINYFTNPVNSGQPFWVIEMEQFTFALWTRYQMSRCVARCLKNGNAQAEFNLLDGNRGVIMPDTSPAPIESHAVEPTANNVFTAKQIKDGGLVCTHAAMELETQNFLQKPSIFNRKVTFNDGVSH
ncbi:hypothetical protein DPMN_071943 [Dreissena polymorpha]|uniref:Uncharacterized protein n=1 Tax=Dreissena polymorpha TaxID=45954 RepID=A0A9D3Z7W8_DREPO|nr:hypothetical protein DPMN_071943 [Dreissena polymorpha]